MKLRIILFLSISLFTFYSFAMSDKKQSKVEPWQLKSCLNESFYVDIRHPSMLFGLIESKLTVLKELCLIELK